MFSIHNFLDNLYLQYLPEFQADYQNSSGWHRLYYLFMPLFLFASILIGFFSKLLITLNLELSSDSVIPGLITREIWQYHNYLIQGYHLEGSYTAIFTDTIPFYAIPQIITNFSPLAIRISSFIIFVLTIILICYIIYYYSRSYFLSIIFAALLLTIEPQIFSYYISPLWHEGTFFFTMLLILVFLDFTTRYSDYSIVIASSLLVGLMVFSDSLIIITFLVPYIIYYIFFQKKNSFQSHMIIAFTCFIAITANVLKNSPLLGYYPHEVHFINLPVAISTNIPFFFKSLCADICFGLYSTISGNISITGLIIGGVFSLVFIGTIYWTIHDLLSKKRDNKEDSARSLILFLIISDVIFFISFILTVAPDTNASPRYLTFTALTLFILIIFACRKKNMVLHSLILVIIFFGVVSNLLFLPSLMYHPNQEQYDLLAYLKENNLTYGFGDYWDADVLTYLSGESIIIRPVQSDGPQFHPYGWNSADRWFYESLPDIQSVFILDHSNAYILEDDINGLIQMNPPEKILQRGNYRIIVFPIGKNSKSFI